MLDCQRLSVTHQNHQLLQPLDLTIEKGQRWVVIGRNGSGKTTLLRAIAGLLIHQGRVCFHNTPLTNIGLRQRSQLISFVPQHSQVDDRLKLDEYMALSHWSNPHSSATRKRIMSSLNIDSLAPRTMGQLSGGQRQRAHIARALCQQSELIVLDEPLNHLDPCAKGEVLSSFIEQKSTLICSLHDISLTAKFATHIAILDQGKLVASGPTKQLLNHQHLQPIFNVDLVQATNGRTQQTSQFFDIELNQGLAH